MKDLKNQPLIQKPNTGQENTPDSAAVMELVKTMCTVDLSDPEATLNATTISDGQGGRILL
jgi:hypothetical protein